MMLSAIPVSVVESESVAVTGTAGAFTAVMRSGQHWVFCSPIAVWLRLSSNGADAEVGGATSFFWPAATYIALAARGSVNRVSVVKHTGTSDTYCSLTRFGAVV